MARYSGKKRPITCFFIFIFILLVVYAVAFFTTVNLKGPVTENDVYSSVGDADGIVLIGHVFRINVPNRTMSVVWQAAGCGKLYSRSDFDSYSSLNGGTSDNCGVPNVNMSMFIDGSDTPAWNFDPSKDPFRENHTDYTRLRTFVTSFDIDISTFVLNLPPLHNPQFVGIDFLYPFSIYETKHSFLALTPPDENSTTPTFLPILNVTFVDCTDNFVPAENRRESNASVRVDGTVAPTHLVTLTVTYSRVARLYSMSLFTVNWLLTLVILYVTIAVLSMSRSKGVDTGVLVLPASLIFTIANIRGLFVGNPAFGILLDVAGLFLQMSIFAFCAVILLMLIRRKLRAGEREEFEKQMGRKLYA